jgi:required for meiotic nuclear division protein 1
LATIRPALAETTFRAFHLSEHFKLTSILTLFSEKPFRASGNEVAYRFGKNQYVILYNFGSLVFYNVDPVREQQILSMIQRSTVIPAEEILNQEEFSLEEGKPQRVDFRKVIFDGVTYEKIQLVSLILAQSTSLDYYETLVNQLLEKTGSITETLEKAGRIRRKSSDILKFIGLCLNTKQKVISSTYILDTPEPTWEDAGLEKLYRELLDNFEIRDRYRTMEYKLRTIQETLEILSDVIHSRRMLALELIIVALIAFEVFLYFVSKS